MALTGPSSRVGCVAVTNMRREGEWVPAGPGLHRSGRSVHFEAATKGTLMARQRLLVARAFALAGILVAGLGASAALATPGSPTAGGPPTTVPGSPGDDCSHGNSGDDCRPDPNENGKDCDDHGNARGNEDHCEAATTTTTTDPTTTTTTTTPTTSTTPEPPTTSTNPTSTGTPGAPSTPTATPVVTPSSSPGETASGSTPPPAKPEPQKQPTAQVKGASVSHASPRGELPFTGFPAWVLALVGATMLLTGIALRRATS